MADTRRTGGYRTEGSSAERAWAERVAAELSAVQRVSAERVAARCAGAAREVEGLASRLRRLPPPSWTGPAATAFVDGLRHPVGGLDAAAEALRRADAAARRLGVR